MGNQSCNLQRAKAPDTPNTTENNTSLSLQPPQHHAIRSSNLPELSSSNNVMHPIPPPKSPPKASEFLCLTPLPSLELNQSLTSNQKRHSKLLLVNNGITGKYISSRICKIAATFWKENIDPLCLSDQLEIGCSIFFTMLSANDEMKKVMKSNFSNEQKIENVSLRYLEMMGWLMRFLITDNIDLHSLLSALGAVHQRMGINITHFDPMLQAMHQTFSYYFKSQYNFGVKYAMDEIFSLAAQLITGENLKGHLNDITQQFQGSEVPFLKNLSTCLDSAIGREYLYRYLAQTWCDEIAIFLQSLRRFKNLMTNTQRYIVAKDIIKTSIRPEAAFAINISYESRTNIIDVESELEERFVKKQPFEISAEFFAEAEMEIRRLLTHNHWRKFVEGIKNLQSKSFNVC